jgi:hypothetical protein
MHLFGVWFSYFSPWPGFIQSSPMATMNRVYNSPEVITLDELKARPPVITAAGPVAGGAFQLIGTGPRGTNYHLVATSDLSVPLAGWVNVTNGAFTGGVFTANDPQAPGNPKRFYRIKVP